jgi:pyruvate/2-oxoglutarate dehydrogenase complex dihydrolipoamide acyltransferase (E2) component
MGHPQRVRTVVEFQKKPGNHLSNNEIVLVGGTEKTAVEMESRFERTLLKILAGVSRTVPVNTSTAIYEAPGEEA